MHHRLFELSEIRFPHKGLNTTKEFAYQNNLRIHLKVLSFEGNPKFIDFFGLGHIPGHEFLFNSRGCPMPDKAITNPTTFLKTRVGHDFLEIFELIQGVLHHHDPLISPFFAALFPGRMAFGGYPYILII